ARRFAHHGARPGGGPGRQRAQPAAAQGSRPRGAQRGGAGPRRRQGGHVLSMATANVVDQSGAATGTVELAAAIFDGPIHEPVMHQALLRQLANGRQGSHDTRNRREVRGGGRKPYKQKGTGRARQGSVRAPQYAGGGVVFGPTPRSYRQDMPRKQRRLA